MRQTVLRVLALGREWMGSARLTFLRLFCHDTWGRMCVRISAYFSVLPFLQPLFLEYPLSEGIVLWIYIARF